MELVGDNINEVFLHVNRFRVTLGNTEIARFSIPLLFSFVFIYFSCILFASIGSEMIDIFLQRDGCGWFGSAGNFTY